MINRYDKCPHCNIDWNGGDVLEVMSKLDVFMNISKTDLKIIVAHYGWTEENPSKFSKTISHQIGDKLFYRCPNIRCGHVFNAETGEEFNSLFDANQRVRIEDYINENPENLKEVAYPELLEEMVEFANEGKVTLKEETNEESIEQMKTVTEVVDQMFNQLGMSSEQAFKAKPQPNQYGTNTSGDNKGFDSFFRQVKK